MALGTAGVPRTESQLETSELHRWLVPTTDKQTRRERLLRNSAWEVLQLKISPKWWPIPSSLFWASGDFLCRASASPQGSPESWQSSPWPNPRPRCISSWKTPRLDKSFKINLKSDSRLQEAEDFSIFLNELSGLVCSETFIFCYNFIMWIIKELVRLLQKEDSAFEWRTCPDPCSCFYCGYLSSIPHAYLG